VSAILLDQVLAYVRGQFTPAEVAEVIAYGGEFSTGEIDKVSYRCPSIFIAVLGWQPEPNGKRLAGKYVRSVKMAAFVAYKAAKRDQRMLGAMNLADRLSMALRRWRPDDADSPISIAPLEEDAVCENLYGRAIDAKGQALWLVRWEQCIKPLVPVEQLVDLVAIDIKDLTRRGVTDGEPPSGTVIVTEDVQFPADS
jgi:hypothetical protein